LKFNIKIYELEKNLNKKLILKLKNKFYEKKNLIKQEFIGCGGDYSMIYKNSF
jgi:hypothetical protein